MPTIQPAKAKKENKVVVLLPEEEAALAEGIRSADKDHRYTLDEAVEFARKRRNEWMKKPANGA